MPSYLHVLLGLLLLRPLLHRRLHSLILPFHTQNSACISSCSPACLIVSPLSFSPCPRPGRVHLSVAPSSIYLSHQGHLPAARCRSALPSPASPASAQFSSQAVFAHIQHLSLKHQLTAAHSRAFLHSFSRAHNSLLVSHNLRMPIGSGLSQAKSHLPSIRQPQPCHSSRTRLSLPPLLTVFLPALATPLGRLMPRLSACPE